MMLEHFPPILMRRFDPDENKGNKIKIEIRGNDTAREVLHNIKMDQKSNWLS